MLSDQALKVKRMLQSIKATHQFKESDDSVIEHLGLFRSVQSFST